MKNQKTNKLALGSLILSPLFISISISRCPSPPPLSSQTPLFSSFHLPPHLPLQTQHNFFLLLHLLLSHFPNFWNPKSSTWTKSEIESIPIRSVEAKQRFVWMVEIWLWIGRLRENEGEQERAATNFQPLRARENLWVSSLLAVTALATRPIAPPLLVFVHSLSISYCVSHAISVSFFSLDLTFCVSLGRDALLW